MPRSAGSGRGRRLLVAIAAAGVALAAAAPIYGAIWAATGSPLYPFPLRLLGHTLSAGNPEFADVLSGRAMGLHAGARVNLEFLRALLLPVKPPGFPTEYFGIGLAAPLCLLLGIDGIARRIRERRGLVELAALVGLAALPLVALLSPELLAERTYWKFATGRLVLPLPAVLLALAAIVPGRFARRVLALVAAINLCESLPLGFSVPALAGMARLALLVAGLALGVALLVRVTAGRRIAALLVGAVALAVLGAGLERIRAPLRHPIYAAMVASPPAFEMHAVWPQYAGAARLWRFVDDGAPHHIALTAGWDGVGHNLLREPLLGSRLQNHMCYVPITTDGSIVDYRNREALRHASPRAWLRRLVDDQIDLVVALGPPPPEVGWMQSDRTLFQLAAADDRGFNRVYRLDRERARSLLGDPGR